MNEQMYNQRMQEFLNMMERVANECPEILLCDFNRVEKQIEDSVAGISGDLSNWIKSENPEYETINVTPPGVGFVPA